MKILVSIFERVSYESSFTTNPAKRFFCGLVENALYSVIMSRASGMSYEEYCDELA